MDLSEALENRLGVLTQEHRQLETEMERKEKEHRRTVTELMQDVEDYKLLYEGIKNSVDQMSK